MANSYDVRLSKKLSYLLRHAAVKEGLHIKSDGFVNLNEILQKLPNHTLQDIQNIVNFDPKNRYSLRTNAGNLEIRANQGHSIAEISELHLTPITTPNFEIVHGTFFSNWEQIKKQGLSRMKRNHIHFSKNLNFQAGLRQNAQIFIFIDSEKATKDGIQFFESENSVILSPGNESGVLEPKYFAKVVDKSGRILS